jgi:hypothetical protein
MVRRVLCVGRGRRGPLVLAAPIHEENDEYGILAENLNAPLYYLQDGYLPRDFSSCYLRYFHGAAGYLVWDEASKGIFARHGLKSWRSGLFHAMELPRLPARPMEVKQVLVLTSGSGDWTAVKNRSDEDQMFETFVEVARYLPDVDILYRPHPLWVDPVLQGPHSIERLQHYVEAAGVRNLSISTGAMRESAAYRQGSWMFRRSESIQAEMSAADVVFGDHSQMMLSAGRMGKIFASVNVSKRASLFAAHNKLGFPHFRDAEGIAEFVRSLQGSSEWVIRYNAAVQRYNNMEALTKADCVTEGMGTKAMRGRCDADWLD